MECKNCDYYNKEQKSCKIRNKINVKACYYDSVYPNTKVEDMNICYNCKHWIGGGDWGLSCRKNYYHCSVNGFDKACDKFERELRGE